MDQFAQSMANQITAQRQVGRTPILQAAAEPVYFALEIAAADVECGGETVQALKPGGAYNVCVFASRYPDAEAQAYPLERAVVKLALQATPESVLVSDPVTEVAKGLLNGFVHCFKIEIEPDCTETEAHFTLTSKRESDKQRLAVELNVAIEIHGVEERKFLEEVHIDPAIALPDCVAVLHTNRDQSGNWVLDGWNQHRKHLDRVVARQPALSAAWLENLDDSLIPLVWIPFHKP